MTKQTPEHELVRAYVGTAWTPQRALQVRRGVSSALNRRRKTTQLVITVGVLTLVGGGWWARGAWLATNKEMVSIDATANIAHNALTLADGSSISTTEASASVRDLVNQVRVSARDTFVQLAAAGVRVQVNGPRTLHLQVRELTVEVLGATFVVTQAQGRLEVVVQQGEARVLWPQGEKTIAAGESFVVPLDEGGVAKQPEGPRREVKAAGSTWQALAHRGRFDEAFVALQAALSTQGKRAVPDEPGALLLAADAARLSHHPEQALPHLQKFVAQWHRDPRASMAAFTMGLVLLEELGRPREAAHAFAQSGALGPKGDLVEDALARQAEAAFRAGDAEQARHAANEYLLRFPQGRRARAVKRFGALE